jgi:hypothetical protein
MVKKSLLICGIVSSLLYVGADIFSAMSWEGYSYTSQAVSELMAIGAPTRPLLIALFSVYNALVIAFGIGVWLSAGLKRSLRVTGILLVTYGVIGQVGLLFAPMHLRGAQETLTDTMHIIVTGVIVLLTLLFIGFGFGARGKWFRTYSILTIVALLVFGALASLQGPRLAAGLPTPWMGVMERMNIYLSMLWVLVLAVVLLRAQGALPQGNSQREG